MTLDIRRTISFPDRPGRDADYHELRCYIAVGAEIVVEEALGKLSRRLGYPATLGALVELLAADYLASP